MEKLVYTELEKQKELLSNLLKDKYRLTDSDFATAYGILEKSLHSMINMMKEGKSAHEKFFSDIILNSIDAIVGFDNKHKIFLWNKGADKMFGYTQAEAAGKSYSLIIPGNLIEIGEVEYILNELNKSGYMAGYETKRITKSGNELDVSISRFLIHDSDGKRIGSVAIIRDMTAIKSLQKELREKENLALIGEVVSSIAHSFSNPLNIISGNADYLLLDKKQSDEGYDEIKTILEESARITRSIRQLLNLSRPMKIDKGSNSITEVINDISAKSKFLFGEKKIIIKKCFDGDTEEFLFAKNEIREVISNIVTNAIQAAGDSGEIKLSTFRRNGFLEIEIKDNGAGISKENMDKIFMPFYSSKAFGKGTGLGLSIAKRIVNEHNGEINVKSIPGKGTTFTISLPYLK